jgi:transcription elongation factor GreA
MGPSIPGFPVYVGGAGEGHAPFRKERRTRNLVQGSEAGNPGSSTAAGAYPQNETQALKSATRRKVARAVTRIPDHCEMPEHIKKKLEEQIRVLEHELTHELPIEIKKAASLGDLSENAEYHMAKQRQVFVNARLGQLKKRMAELALVNLSNIPKDRIAFGSTVVVFDTTKNEEITYKLVTSEESDVNQGLISTTSPIGRGLVGKQVGDIAAIVTPNGKRELEILKLTTIHDEEA